MFLFSVRGRKKSCVREKFRREAVVVAAGQCFRPPHRNITKRRTRAKRIRRAKQFPKSVCVSMSMSAVALHFIRREAKSCVSLAEKLIENIFISCFASAFRTPQSELDCLPKSFASRLSNASRPRSSCCYRWHRCLRRWQDNCSLSFCFSFRCADLDYEQIFDNPAELVVSPKNIFARVDCFLGTKFHQTMNLIKFAQANSRCRQSSRRSCGKFSRKLIANSRAPEKL
jgi:hypothetical protein